MQSISTFIVGLANFVSTVVRAGFCAPKYSPYTAFMAAKSPPSRRNTEHFRSRMTELGFDILPGDHPIVPVMIGDAAQAGRMADALISRGVYAVAFSYPVVPHGKARIRTQMSAAHTIEELDFAVDQFAAARDEVG